MLFADSSLGQNARFHSIFRLYEERSHALFSKQLELHVVELPRLPASVESHEALLTLWCKFLSAKTDAELDALAEEDPIMTQAKAVLEELSEDAEARRRAEFRRMSEMAYWTSVNVARGQGREEGRAKGREEGRAKGREEGRAKGREEDRAEGREEGRVDTLVDCCR